jgi:hypothetical protein
MMKWTKWVCVGLFALIAFQGIAQAGESRPVQLNNRMRFEYDDNIYQTKTDKTDSFKFIEEVELLVNFTLPQTFVSLRYRPSFVWWDKREPDQTDLQHEGDFVLNHTFSPRLALSMVDTLRRGVQPEEIDNNVVVREEDNFYYNTLNGTLTYSIRPQTRVEVAGRYILLRYDDDAVSTNEDFDLYVGGLTLRQQVVRETTILGSIRLESVDYNGFDRGSDSLFLGAGVEQVFSPNLLGSLSGGYQNKEFNDDAISSQSSPYGDVSLTYLPSPATRITAGGGYSLFETDVFPFANQERTQLFLSLAHDFTARLSFYLTGGWTRGNYDAAQSVEQDTVKSGEENILQISGRATYKVNRNNWLEAGWQYVDFDSGLEYTSGSAIRESYIRNRIDVGWKTRF